MDRNPFPHGEAMKKPSKTTQPKKRRKARVVISGGGTHQKPLDPTVARFASRISKAFSGTTPD
jgi:DNA-binding transcriptional regulator LsrR (DeoR family)